MAHGLRIADWLYLWKGGKVAGRSLLSTINKNKHFESAKTHWNYHCKRMLRSEETKMECSSTCLPAKEECIQGETPHTYCQICRWVIDVLLLVVKVHYFRSMAKFWPKIWSSLLRSWDFVRGRCHTELVKCKRHPSSAMAISPIRNDSNRIKNLWSEWNSP